MESPASKNIRGEVAYDFCDTLAIFQCQIWWVSFAGAASHHFGRARPPDHFPRISKCAVLRKPFAHSRCLQTRKVKKCRRVAPDLSSVSSMGLLGAPRWLVGARWGLPANQPACQHASQLGPQLDLEPASLSASRLASQSAQQPAASRPARKSALQPASQLLSQGGCLFHFTDSQSN